MIRQLLANIVSTIVIAATVNAALAGTPTQGSDAPELGELNWVLNRPDTTSIKDCRGDVVIVERWGVNCGPCVRLIPHLNELQKKYGSAGLHIFAIESQNHTADQIKALMAPMNVVYPVANGGGNAYQTGGGIPHAWVIGVDGKVVFEGNPYNGMDKVVEEEMKKIKYPGLGKADVAKEAAKSAAMFSKGQYAAARKEAKKLAENEKASDEAKADAQFIVERATNAAGGRLALAKKLEGEKDFLGAIENYDWVAKNFKGEEEGNSADARLKELKADKEVKKEIDAQIALNKIIESVKKPNASPDIKSAIPALKSFAKKFDGTKAAKDAEELISANTASAGK